MYKRPKHLSKLATSVLLFTGCLFHSNLQASAPRIIDDATLRSKFDLNAGELVGNNDYTPIDELKRQLSRKSCQLKLPVQGKDELRPADIYSQRLDSVVLVGTLKSCHNPNCKKIHSGIATGVVIHSDGMVLTNYHVVDSEQPRALTVAVMTVTGKSFLVDEVLAADEKADIAILKLKDAQSLQAAPLSRDEPVGNPVTIISHPAGQFYTLTHGLVSRYVVGPDGEQIMNVTADYARGSSGGPVFNDRGNIIGLVANTKSITYRSVPLAFDGENEALVKVSGKARSEFGGLPVSLGLSHQMTFKNATASSEVFELIE